MTEPNENDPPRDRPLEPGGGGRDRDDDDRPRRRRDEEDRGDDRPRRRRRDEDDFDDRPRRGAKGSGGGPVVALIIGGVFLGCLLVGCVLIGLLLPAVQKVREAASRTKDSNNMKILALGTHNYHDQNGKLPPANDENLSWRYHLLPYIEQDNLHKAMNPREPWDGPTNRRFANTKVQTFVSVGDPPETVETRYRAFVGPNTLHEPGKKPLSFAEISDGTANTILYIEARETVPWAQPKELPYDRNGSLPTLGAPGRNGFLVAMADGSVRFIANSTSPEVIRGGIEPRDGRLFNP